MKTPLILHIVNYGVRGAIVALGICFLTGVFDPWGFDVSFLRMMGVVFVLFGLYRITIYYSHSKRYRRLRDEERD